MKDGDIYMHASHGNAGFGDPLDREPAMVEEDLNQELITEDCAEGVYGVEASLQSGRWTANLEATKALREKARAQRKQKAVLARDWWLNERKKVLSKEFTVDQDLYNMYADSLGNEKFKAKFSEFWQLPEDYAL